MDSVERDFLAAIADNPGHDAPRLAWAAWLAGKDPANPRAALVRMECEHAALAEKDPAAAILRKRMAPLVQEVEKEHADLVASSTRRRGFVHAAKVRVDAVTAKRVAAFFSREPVLEELELDTEGCDERGHGDLAALLAAPALGNLRILSIPGASYGTDRSPRDYSDVRIMADDRPFTNLGEVVLLGIAKHPGIRRLERLTIGNASLSPKALETFLGSPAVSRLRTLVFESCSLGDAGIRVLCEASGLGELERLVLSFPEAESLASLLAGSANLGNLTELDLSHCDIGPEGARVLAASPHLARMKKLVLAGNRMGWEGMAAILGSASLTRVRALDLSSNTMFGGKSLPASGSLAKAPMRPEVVALEDNELDEASAAVLASFPGFVVTGHFAQKRGPFGDAAALVLVSCPGFRPTDVSLESSEIGTEGLVALAKLPSLRSFHLAKIPLASGALARIGEEASNSLVELSATNSKVSLGDLTALSATPLANRLTSLWVAYNGLSGDVLPLLERFPAVRDLGLDGNDLGRKGARALTKALRGRPMKTLLVRGCGLADGAERELRDALTGCTLYVDHG